MTIKRKDEHISLSAKSRGKYDFFKDIHMIYNSLPELNFYEIDTNWNFFNRNFDAPLIINAITGGSTEGKDINEALANAALRFNIPMAVGSQSIGLKDRSSIDSFTVVRKVNKKGFIMANISAGAAVNVASQVVEMIEADGLQLHLNVLQELVMQEGDRSFKGLLENIKEIALHVNVPVIVKEVGFGMTGETALKLNGTGIKAIDIGGFGGTNFAQIENMRRDEKVSEDLQLIGIPTTASLYDVVRKNLPLHIISGGGIKNGIDIVKSLIMGAHGASIAYPLLGAFKDAGADGVHKELGKIIYELKVGMIAAGAGSVGELADKKIIITGQSLQWIKQMEKQEFS